jgi:hypothetical protein
MNKNVKIALGILAGVVIGYFIFRKKPIIKKDSIEEELKTLAKSISPAEEKNVTDVLNTFASPKNKFNENEKQMWLRVYKGILLAKKDKKWDDKSTDLKAKKTILLSYGVKGNEIDWFIKTT